MSTIGKNALKTASIGAAFGLGLTLAVTPMANAVTYDRPNDGKCYADATKEEPRTETHYDTVIIPGEEAVIGQQELWGRDVDAVEEVRLRLTQYSRTVEVPTEVTVEQWFNKRWVEKVQEVAYYLHQFSRLNPGKAETFKELRQYQQIIPAKEGVKTHKWKTSVDDFKVKHQYQKQVSGVIQAKDPYGKWKNTGKTFAGEWWTTPFTKWSFDDKEVLESGPHSEQLGKSWFEDGIEYRKFTTAYQYVKNGVTEQVKTGSHWEYQWGIESPGDNWIKTNTWKWETEPQLEQTILYKDGEHVEEDPGAPWVEVEGSVKPVGNDDAIAPFTEYLAQDGTATPNQDEAGKFKEDAIEGWTPFGEPEKVVDQEETPGYWLYATRDEDGVLGESRNPEDAATFTSEVVAPENPDYIAFGHTTVTKPGESTFKTVYLTGLPGALEETDNPEDASWLEFDLIVPEGFAYVLDADGVPVLYEELVSAEEPGYFEYWRLGPDGNVLPTRVLTESNWFDPNKVSQLPSEEEGWRFLRERDYTIKKATPDQEIEVGTSSTSMVKVTIQEEIPCPLPATGGSFDAGPASLAGLAGIGLGGLLLTANRRRRRLAEAA